MSSLARVVLALAVLAGGCAGPASQGSACRHESAVSPIEPTELSTVDLLLAIDDSNGGGDEQDLLVPQLPSFFRRLTTGDLDDDGVRDFTAATSIHVGVVSSDMGVGDPGVAIDSCRARFGDDGIMQATSSGEGGCALSYASAVFELTAGSLEPSTADVGCVVRLGTSGCGLEQQLDSVLKAVSLVPTDSGESPVDWTRPGYRPPVFTGGTFGQIGAGRPNDGFLRPGSLLAIVIVTDEDDCSTPNTSFFDRSDPRYSAADLGTRCIVFPGELYDPSRYVDGLIGLRRDPHHLVFGAIVGVPVDAARMGLAPEALLGLAEMQIRPDPMTRALARSCTREGPIRYGSPPPRRIVSVAAGLERLGAHTTVQSVCETDFAGPLDAIVREIASALHGPCLAATLEPDAAGMVPCEVIEALPVGVAHCSELPNAEAYEAVVDAMGERCRVRQVTPRGTDAGWYYDDGRTPSAEVMSACPNGITFRGVSPIDADSLRAECWGYFGPTTAHELAVGAPCDPTTGDARWVSGRCTDVGLTCDPMSRTCAQFCASDADCAAAGLLAYVCDPRTASEIYEERDLPAGVLPEATHPFCVVPRSCADDRT